VVRARPRSDGLVGAANRGQFTRSRRLTCRRAGPVDTTPPAHFELAACTGCRHAIDLTRGGAFDAHRFRPSSRSTVLLADVAVMMLKESDGLTTAALAKQTGADRDQVLGLLKDLESAGSVRRSGQHSGTRWHAITDEDRIQARAAELAARVRQ